MLVCNQGFHDFFANWVAYAAELGYDRHFLAFTEDDDSFQFVERNWPGQAVRYHVNHIAGMRVDPNSTVQKEQSIQSPGFKLIMYRRMYYMLTLLNLGFQVLLCDVDLIWIRDPFPYLTSGDYDVYVSLEKLNQVHHSTAAMRDRIVPLEPSNTVACGCFLFFTQSLGSRVAFSYWLMHTLEGKKDKYDNDQSHLETALKELFSLSARVKIGVLPQQLFPPGWLYFRQGHWREKNKDKVVTVHSNWIVGRAKKKATLVEHGLWKLGPDWDKKESERKGVVAAESTGEGGGGGGGGGIITVDTYISEQQGFGQVAKAAAKDSMLIICIVHPGELRLFLNWVESVKRMGHADRFLAMVYTKNALDVISKQWPGRALLLNGTALHESIGPDPQGRPQHSPFLRPLIIGAALQQGLSCLYTDVTSVWLKDPFPFLPPEFDLVARVFSLTNKQLEARLATELAPFALTEDSDPVLYASFVFFRPTPRSLEIVESWTAGHSDEPYTLSHLLLSNVVKFMMNSVAPPKIGVLPVKRFPPGRLVFRDAEWLKGNLGNIVAIENDVDHSPKDKAKSLSEIGLWLI